MLIDLLPETHQDFYVRNATGPGIIYKENDATDLTSTIDKNEGANVFIRKSNEKKMVKPSVCPKAHCPDSFQYSIG